MRGLRNLLYAGISIILLFNSCGTESNPEPETPEGFFLDENGITIRCTQTSPGETGIVDGVEYEAVDRDLLLQKIEEGADLTKVCTTPVGDMWILFSRNEDFNQDIGNWDVSNVSNMDSMFRFARSFNQDISAWDTGNVTNMSSMFEEAHSFNQDIGSWDVSNVVYMSSTFSGALSFNQDIGD